MGLPCFGLCGLSSYLSDLVRFIRIVVRVLTEGLGWGKTTSARAKTNCNMGKLHQLRIQGARILEESCIYTCMDPYHHDE